MPEDSGEFRAMQAGQASVDGPVTPAGIARDLRRLGVENGMLLNVHSALSRLGWVVGGAQGVIEALLDVVGDSGTLMMPSHSGQLSEPANWRQPPAPEAWWETIRSEMPAYHPARTPTRLMGAIAETFRAWPGVQRSLHPQSSHTALGPRAAEIVAEHPLEAPFGDASPMGKLYDLNGHVLLLGVGHGNNTVLHLAEHRADFPGKRSHREGAPIRIDGERRWQTFHPLQIRTDDFAVLGEAFAATGGEIRGAVGAADAILMRARDVVDFAVPWFEANRTASE